jgi:3-hydroxyisobutyrate dehydrogenase-like beta-hydroxyacid dehydrogenase
LVADTPQYTQDSAVVGVVGLGAMGSGIAESLLRAGFPVVVADLRHDAVEKLVAAGAIAASDLADLAAQCAAVLVVVLDDHQVTTVVDGLAAAPGQMGTVIITSTVMPETVQALAARLAPAGIALVDAPVSGGAEKSALGTLTVLVGGTEQDMLRCRPVIDAIADRVFHVGPVGAGSAAKLVNNVLALGGYVLQVEAMQLAEAYGITEDSAVEFITVSAGDSHGIRTWGRYDRLRRTHTLAGTPAMYDMLGKDLRAAAVAAGKQGVSLPITATLGEVIGPKMLQRDKVLEARGGLRPERLCPACGQELAAPFLEAGRHPHCPSR